jgi:putative sigma-54 modulation protein
MQVKITGQHVDITEPLRAFIEEKLLRIERHVKPIQQVHVILHLDKNAHRAEATVNLKGTQLFAESLGEDMYAAIDTLIDKLDRQAIKHKEKMKDHHSREDE